MMRGKSPPSELLLEIIKSNNSLSNIKEIEKGDIFMIVKILSIPAKKKLFRGDG